MTRKSDLPPGSSVGIVLLIWAAVVCLTLGWVFSASAQVVSCLSPAQLLMFLYTTDLPFAGVPEGILVHAEQGSVLYVLTDGLYCIDKGEK